MTPAEDVLMSAISDYLAPNRDQRTAGVRIAIAGLHGCGWDPAAVAEFTALLTGHEPALPAAHAAEVVPTHIDNAGQVVSAFHPGDCITCHGHVDAGGVFHPAAAS